MQSINGRRFFLPLILPKVRWGLNGRSSGANPNSEAVDSTVCCRLVSASVLDRSPHQIIRGFPVFGKVPIPESRISNPCVWLEAFRRDSARPGIISGSTSPRNFNVRWIDRIAVQRTSAPKVRSRCCVCSRISRQDSGIGTAMNVLKVRGSRFKV